MKKMKKTIVLCGMILTVVLLMSCSKKQEKKSETEITILAAASLTEVTEKLAEEYKKIAPEIKLTFSYGSSGTLQTQIEEGAPADLFISAASKQMDALQEKGLLADDTRMNVLYNKLVLITPNGITLPTNNFEVVSEDDVKLVALGDPESVPAGQYAKESLEFLGIWEKIEGKCNFATDVKQVLTWIETKEADCGFVYQSDATNNDKVTIVCAAPEGSHKDIIYPAAILKNSTKQVETKDFLEFLSTQAAKDIFEEFGFSAP